MWRALWDGMKTPQASWDNEVAANIARVRAEQVRLDMVSTLNTMKAQLAKATGYEAEVLAESITELEADIAEAS